MKNIFTFFENGCVKSKKGVFGGVGTHGILDEKSKKSSIFLIED